ncbi:SDR family NAD(P)-dependent oxidoreductase [bacterium]|nr:SDR family NAD(P)-dependent oxidoreductase [bacterium]
MNASSERKVCLITGATSGIGRAAARELARRDYQLILVGRSEKRCLATVAELAEIAEGNPVEYFLADLSSYKSIQELGILLRSRIDHIDVLVNNAGAVFMRKERSADNLEMTWALNHFGYVWLTEAVLPLLEKSPCDHPRIVNVSSAAHQRARIKTLDGIFERKDLKDLMGYFTYGETKLANLWFTFELARRLAPRIRVNALHPGFVATRFAGNNGIIGLPLVILTMIFGISPEEGAKTIVHLVDSPSVEDVTGAYFVREKEVLPSALARDEKLAYEFFELSRGFISVDTR